MAAEVGGSVWTMDIFGFGSGGTLPDTDSNTIALSLADVRVAGFSHSLTFLVHYSEHVCSQLLKRHVQMKRAFQIDSHWINLQVRKARSSEVNRSADADTDVDTQTLSAAQPSLRA